MDIERGRSPLPEAEVVVVTSGDGSRLVVSQRSPDLGWRGGSGVPAGRDPWLHPRITSNYDQLSVIDPDSQAELLGLFEVSVVHNIVHLVFGVAGLLAVARASASASVSFLVGGGILCAGMFVYGLLVEQGSDLDILPMTDTDNFLHLGLSIGMILLGVLGAAVLRATEVEPDSSSPGPRGLRYLGSWA